MHVETLVRSLGRETTLTVESSDQLVAHVRKCVEQERRRRGTYLPGKSLTPVLLGQPFRTSAAEVLHELGVATTFLDAAPLAQVARHWAHVRYCATLTERRGHLALSRYAGNTVYHHKVTQSEQLGIGLALVVAKTLLRRQHPGWEFHAVDAEVALKAGFLDGAGTVKTRSATKKRPDYILLGHHSSGRRSGMKIFVLECKGTHGSATFAYEQLARATEQVDALRVGGCGQPSLMVASCLSRSRITSYVLDPPGEDDLWTGADEDLDELLRASPEEHEWQPGPARPPDEPSDAAVPTERILSPTEDEPDAPVVFDVPADQRGWFTQILTRAAAATALLFAGDNATAGAYTTRRQRGEQTRSSPELLDPEQFDPESVWTSSTTQTLRMRNGLRAEGTRYRAPLPSGRILEVFRGLDSNLYRLLAQGRVGPYLRAAPRTIQRWSSLRSNDEVVSVGRDGTVLVIRLDDDRQRL
ncbi:hypothetical protein O7605_26025 [Verrucosispora sp. WMMA2121]|uniref:hypothetical protein n=1 Tax=Verrucosispora sp. WMMA2121 TaxID=3015164 RepID=UPI0022B648A6|nr:hypothetical protein [Verrucosispora sp. WMMA2121]MCZ7422966.1 hypothetical protein [Verrucosispora sp. WMMA2121]